MGTDRFLIEIYKVNDDNVKRVLSASRNYYYFFFYVAQHLIILLAHMQPTPRVFSVYRRDMLFSYCLHVQKTHNERNIPIHNNRSVTERNGVFFRMGTAIVGTAKP